MRWLGKVGDLLRRHRKITIAVAAGLIVGAVGITALVLRPAPNTSPPIAYTNISRNFKTCLLSTSDEASQAAPVWQAIQTATTKAAINAQHITAPAGPASTLVPYFNSLIALHCQLIVSTGNILHDAVVTTATGNPHTQFLNIGLATNLPNVRDLPSSSTNPSAVTQYILAKAIPAH